MREMLEKDKLLDELTSLPEYHKEIRFQPATKRLMALEDCMSQIYIPNQMSVEIYNKMYLASYKASQKKNTALATKQYYENFKLCRNKSFVQGGVMGGSEVFTLIGESGIGKTTAVQRTIELIQDNNDECINVLQVQCPNDCSTKGLLLSILQAFDYATGSEYLNRAVISRYTVDMLIGIVSTACQQYLNLLVVDEIQNIRLNMKTKWSLSNGERLIATLVQLINSTGISVMLVGTPEIEPVFQQEIYLARRTVGIRCNEMLYNKEFYDFCSTIYSYQFTSRVEPFNEEICRWLYQHSSGKIAIVVGLIQTAQEISIIKGTDCLDISALEVAFKERYQNVAVSMKQVIENELPKRKSKKESFGTKVSSATGSGRSTETLTVASIVDFCKKNHKDVVEELRPHMTIVEVKV